MGFRTVAWAGALCVSVLCGLPESTAFTSSSLPLHRTHPHGVEVTLHRNGRSAHGGINHISRNAGLSRLVMSDAAVASALNVNGGLPGYTKFGRIKVKGLDANLIVGPLFVIACFGWALVLYPLILLSAGLSYLFDRQRKRAIDWIVHYWAKFTMLTMGAWPTVIGKENLPSSDEAVMYIPNHCSYLDIFTMSGFVPRPFKYVSKIEILRIPLIGWAMQLAGHIAIKRMDKRSQLQTFKETVETLQHGNSIVTFAEGTRSSTGRLMAFKKGPIKMAIKAKKRIVPVSICDLHRWMPDTALTPLWFPRNVQIKVHAPIDTVGKDEELILKEVYEAVNSGLPEFQKSDISVLSAAPASE